MPGTIHVSVLGFKDLPSSSISVKVSMGKRVYQTTDKDFSFPLATLRDNMIITLHDAEGREISNTGVETMSVVQKGFWDGFLPLAEEGHVQLKLKFVLSEEERDRIRKMRESATKKKHGERFSSSVRCSEPSGAATSVATSDLHATQEVSDGSKEVPSAASVAERSQELRDDKSLSKPAENIGIKSRLVDTPKRPKVFQEASSIKQNNERPNQPEKQEPLRRTPSNVRKMISALETSLDKDVRRIKPPPEVQSYGTVEEKDFKEKPKPAKLNFGKLNNPFLTVELKRIPTNEKRKEEQISLSQDFRMSKTSPETRKKMEDLSSAESEVKETESSATLPGKSALKEQESLHQKSKLLAVDQNFCGTANESAIQSRNSHEPLERLDTEDSLGNGHQSLESSGAWIFADHTRRLCITTGSKYVADLVKHCGIEETNHEGKESFCLQDKVGKRGSFESETCTEMEKANMTSQGVQNLRPESSSNAENPAGPVGQVVKVAIMVAFGALVLLTRQRKPRSINFSSIDYES